ncbi:hypothetical protein BDF20DRAFT_917034 [Mycotypha africana]|uniref:uncharacterized protein n=1 Tax=Mycotypha africana TaxID=64632 RepID=UPI0023005A40|nr:uncharacterized protein BDF20DRAFT_917034 [Mycotypha africana]KAI8968531.1 hypothetical protein BDF20DRAFT_917034 [Mycotypha africana]
MQIKLLNLASTACIFAFVSAAPVVNSDGLDASALNDIEAVGLNDIHLTRRQNLPFAAVGGYPGSDANASEKMVF